MQRWETRQGLKSFIITMSAFRPGWMKQTSLKRFALSITCIYFLPKCFFSHSYGKQFNKTFNHFNKSLRKVDMNTDTFM